MRYIAFALIAAGIAALLAGWRMDAKSSFHDGSFVWQILLFLIAAGCIAAGSIWLGLLVFLGL
jgi:hypothetical protein